MPASLPASAGPASGPMSGDPVSPRPQAHATAMTRRAATPKSPRRARILRPRVDAHGAVLEGDEHLARPRGRDLDVEHRAIGELVELLVAEVLDLPAFEAREPAAVGVSDPDAAVGR